MVSSSKVTGPIVRATPVVNTPAQRTQPSRTNHIAIRSLSVEDQQELLRRSYHESFFVKNTPVTGNEQVTAWLDVNRTGVAPAPHGNATEKPSSLDGTESETTRRRKSILKRSPSIDSNGVNPMVVLRGTPAVRQGSAPQARALGEKVRVKDSLEVINTKLLKDIDTQVNQRMPPRGLSSSFAGHDSVTKKSNFTGVRYECVLCLEKNCSICPRFRKRTVSVRHSTCQTIRDGYRHDKRM